MIIYKFTEINTNQKVKYAILCAKKVYKNKKWNEWADSWLSTVTPMLAEADRAVRVAEAAYRAVRAAETSVAMYAAMAAVLAAESAAICASISTAKTTEATEARAVISADRATQAVRVALAVNNEINLVKIAKEAVNENT